MTNSPALRIVVMTTVPQTLAAFFPRQLRSLAASGFDVHAVSSPGPDLDDLGAIPGVTTHALTMERQPHPVRDAISLGQLFLLFRRLRPQIVHSHTPKAGLLGMAAAKLAGVPIRLYTIHGLPLETRTGSWRRFLEFAERASSSLSTRTYAVSHSLRKVAVKLGLCPEKKLVTLGAGSCAGVDLERFSGEADWSVQRALVRHGLGLPEDAVLLSFLGRLAKDKGIGVLAAAWPEIARRLPQAHLLLAGDLDVTDPIPTETIAELRSHPRVHLLGSVSYLDVPATYAATDIFVLPTFREGLSQVALEASAMGLAIVSTCVTGLDAIVGGETGILVPAHNPAALAVGVIHLAGDAELRRQLGEAARERVRTRFSAASVDQLWMDEYLQLVNEDLPTVDPACTPLRKVV